MESESFNVVLFTMAVIDPISLGFLALSAIGSVNSYMSGRSQRKQQQAQWNLNRAQSVSQARKDFLNNANSLAESRREGEVFFNELPGQLDDMVGGVRESSTLAASIKQARANLLKETQELFNRELNDLVTFEKEYDVSAKDTLTSIRNMNEDPYIRNFDSTLKDNEKAFSGEGSISAEYFKRDSNFFESELGYSDAANAQYRENNTTAIFNNETIAQRRARTLETAGAFTMDIDKEGRRDLVYSAESDPANENYKG